MPLALELFHQLCDIANNLSLYRDTHEPCSDDWTACTCILLTLDGAIDRLVRSHGLGDADDA
jgi:hypothetical protein